MHFSSAQTLCLKGIDEDMMSSAAEAINAAGGSRLMALHRKNDKDRDCVGRTIIYANYLTPRDALEGRDRLRAWIHEHLPGYSSHYIAEVLHTFMCATLLALHTNNEQIEQHTHYSNIACICDNRSRSSWISPPLASMWLMSPATSRSWKSLRSSRSTESSIQTWDIHQSAAWAMGQPSSSTLSSTKTPWL